MDIPTPLPTLSLMTATFTLTPDSPVSTYGNVSIIKNNDYNGIYYNSSSDISSWRCNGNKETASWCINIKLFTPGPSDFIYSINLTVDGKRITSEADVLTTFATSDKYFTIGNDWDSSIHEGYYQYLGGVITAPACSNWYNDGDGSYNYGGIYSFDTDNYNNVFDLLDADNPRLDLSQSSYNTLWIPVRNVVGGGSYDNFRTLTTTRNGATSPFNLGMVNEFEKDMIQISFQSQSINYTSCILNNTSFGRESFINVMITPDHDGEKWEIFSINISLSWS